MKEKIAQTPAEGIMLTHEFSDSKFYRVDCSCGNPEDAIEFSIETEYGEVIVHTSTTQKTDWWSDPANQNASYNYENEFLYELNYLVRGWINGLIHRIKWTWRLWIDGYLKYSSSTIMSEQQALNYAHAIETAVKELREAAKKDEPN